MTQKHVPLKWAPARAKELNESGHPCYDIPMGGASVVGSVGFANGM